MKRRQFLSQAALFSLFWLMPPLRGLALSNSDNSLAIENKLLVIFLRGAADGLNIVAPYGDKRYYEMRPTIALPPPKDNGGLIDLDSYFGLNSSLKPLMTLWGDKSLAFVHASGSPDPTRSHFDAQDYMESGTPGVKSTDTGWMNRLLSVLPKNKSPIRAVNFGPTMPRIFDGPNRVADISLGKAVSKPQVYDRPIISQYFGDMYLSRNDELASAYSEGIKAHHTVMDELKQEMVQANNGATPPNSDFGSQIAKLFIGEANVSTAFIAFGGFDTHVNQGSIKGPLFNHLSELSTGLADLATGLGPVYKKTVVVIVSEFGRTARENGNAGTDHGHGNVMWILGGPVKGGKVYGKFGGLADSELYENRDVPVTTDFRSILCTVLDEHMSVSNKELTYIFPGYSYSGKPYDILS